MIANKHTEVRLISNLNDLLEDSKVKQEINRKIHKHTYEYMMYYVSENDLEDKDVYDVLEDLSKHYQRHSYKITKEVKEEILEENGQEIEVYETIKGVQVPKIEIFLDPKKFSQKFKDNLEEELNTLVVDNYFKELDNVIKVFEYQKKIDVLKEKNVKRNYKEEEEYFKKVARNRIELVYKNYINQRRPINQIITNFEYSREVQDYIYKEIMYLVSDYLKDNVDSYVETQVKKLFEKELKTFIKEKKVFYGLNTNNQSKKTNVKISKPVKWYAITRVWKDILK